MSMPRHISSSRRLCGTLRTADMALIALFAAVMAICAWLSVPTAVPFTMQTFSVFLAIGMLGGRRGTLSVLTYLMLGLFGAPVFAGFAGGVGHLLSATGGYIVGFLVAALVMWALEPMPLRPAAMKLPLSMALGLLACYAFGTMWFMRFYTRSGGPVSLLTALSSCVFPYVLPDIAKIALALSVRRRLYPALRQLSA